MFHKLDSLLAQVVKNPDLHARWLNTFSYLEYVGFRKIVKSQEAVRLDFETLSHAVEEGRHALLLKKLALKAGGPKFDSYSPETLLCGLEAEAYFQSLDRGCEELLARQNVTVGRSRLVYLYVTWLVEVRALSVYSSYQKSAGASEAKSLAGLLAEEDRHLASVGSELRRRDPGFETRLSQVKALEESLYANYIRALEKALAADEVAVARSL